MAPRNVPAMDAHPLRLALAASVAVAAVAACEPQPRMGLPLVPAPAELTVNALDTFTVSQETPVVVDPGDAEAARVAGFLVDWVSNRVEERPAVLEAGRAPAGPFVRLTRADAPEELGDEGYRLSVTRDSIRVQARTGAGLFYGLQTLRQLLPAGVEYTAAFPIPLTAVGVEITDAPRYPWRGAMLDVSRHFFPPADVKRFVDLMALHKLNRLHLGLTNDQGWRVEIPGWPELTRIGGSTEVGGAEGGYYTLDEYRDLVRYAADRFITIVPEIDMPGHINAALASYPELNCDGVAPPLYTGTEVGFSALCLEKDITWRFVEDVVREVSAATPGPWFHVGGDEVPSIPGDAYGAFMRRTREIVAANGKTMVAWDEAAERYPGGSTVIQLWRPDPWRAPTGLSRDSARDASAAALRQQMVEARDAGARFILSPADRFYLDMKADDDQVLGLRWAGVPDLQDTYDWDPPLLMPELAGDAILGVEAPLWTETVGTMADAEYLAFPRLAAVAEFGWTPPGVRSWREFRMRVAAQSARWTAMGINFRRSLLVPWSSGPRDP